MRRHGVRIRKLIMKILVTKRRWLKPSSFRNGLRGAHADLRQLKSLAGLIQAGFDRSLFVSPQD